MRSTRIFSYDLANIDIRAMPLLFEGPCLDPLPLYSTDKTIVLHIPGMSLLLSIAMRSSAVRRINSCDSDIADSTIGPAAARSAASCTSRGQHHGARLYTAEPVHINKPQIKVPDRSAATALHLHICTSAHLHVAFP
jgi:hypothetical protein